MHIGLTQILSHISLRRSAASEESRVVTSAVKTATMSSITCSCISERESVFIKIYQLFCSTHEECTNNQISSIVTASFLS